MTSGTIRVNGVDIRESSQEEVRSKIGFVPQKALLFSGTIAENIRFGKQDATEDEIEHAARIAQAEDFISKMEEGYDIRYFTRWIECFWRTKTTSFDCTGARSKT